MTPAATARREKDAHPERYCPDPRCLWRTGDGSPCPRHSHQVVRRCCASMERFGYHDAYCSANFSRSAGS